MTRLIDLLLYGNFWIAAGAAGMGLQTIWLLTGEVGWSPVVGFLFFSTLFLYALHRIVGLEKLRAFADQDRFAVAFQFRSHIRLYALLGAIGSLYFFYRFPWPLRGWTLAPALLSLGYVVPFLRRRRRLRDLNYLKIFLVALVWAWATVFLPAFERSAALATSAYWMGAERFLYIFAITLPFDIRDLTVDAHAGVGTLPARIGVHRSILLAELLLAGHLAAVWINYQQGAYPLSACWGFGVSALLTGALIYFSPRFEHDYYFSGLLDGTMLLQFGLVWTSQWWAV
ncbi:MAG: hypothetical protein KDC43_24830 [Saprospiraceae bacterium]|nr:hypothetical protein [Saprospiraceae bacterium]MCB0627049.1 hypothetical protein [Saprospiraceae bacterium]MCB0680494.1 hypothetical protein [Saprospiraceae bacterium]